MAQFLIWYLILLNQINRKEDSGKNLSFDDISLITQQVKVVNDISILNLILEIINKDIEIRKQKYGNNCLDDLYNQNRSVSDKVRISKENNSDIKRRIKESIKAIILDSITDFMIRMAGIF